MADTPEDRDEVEEALRKRLRKTDLIFEGGLGLHTDGRLTEEGIDKLLDALTLAGLKVTRP